MRSHSRQLIPAVIQQHVEEAAVLRNIRTTLVRAPHVKLHHLRRLDDRLAAHLDGLAVAGEQGANLCTAALERPGVGEVFAAGVGAILDADPNRLDRLFAIAEAEPDAARGLTSAFGWVSARDLQGQVAGLLSAASALRRRIGIAACAMHRTDPGARLLEAMNDPDAGVRGRAVRAAAELGRADLRAAAIQAMRDDDPGVRLQAAAAALLLGDRERALVMLQDVALEAGPCRAPALRLCLMVLDPPDVHRLLKSIAQEQANSRLLIQSAGIAGDIHYVPWLISLMSDDGVARLAGASFSRITGVDLASLDLERDPPEGPAPGPSEEADDPDVAMDQDDGLPWPDGSAVQAWWDANQTLFQPGRRYFMGALVAAGHCASVLREGYQPQRMAAGLYLCFIQPGRPLFPTSQSAWRQQGLLNNG